jgi:uncharacterized membrane protein YheB (UPF0754 family)
MNKSLLTNLIALLICIVGSLSPLHSQQIFIIGIFALSGGVTNWLAIHMLFEKVPFLYGSGVIPTHFEDFKAGIKKLILEEFFTREQIQTFLQENVEGSASSIFEKVDFDRVFVSLTDAIEASSLGSMLSMVGGKQALEPLRGPVTIKMKEIITEISNESSTAGGENHLIGILVEKVEYIIDARLDELTPENVKLIIQNMIRKHLGWLVVWGGVFGGVIGLVAGLV